MGACPYSVRIYGHQDEEVTFIRGEFYSISTSYRSYFSLYLERGCRRFRDFYVVIAIERESSDTQYLYCRISIRLDRWKRVDRIEFYRIDRTFIWQPFTCLWITRHERSILAGTTYLATYWIWLSRTSSSATACYSIPSTSCHTFCARDSTSYYSIPFKEGKGITFAISYIVCCISARTHTDTIHRRATSRYRHIVFWIEKI